MANTHLAYPNLAIDKFSGTDLDQDTESFIQLIERKINFALGGAPGDAGELANYTFRKKALFYFLLRGPAAKWYESNITNATTWDNVRTTFITRFSDGRNKFRNRMEVEHCIRGDGEEIRKFLHRIKRTVDKGWPDDVEGIAPADHGAERTAQGRQRRQRYINYSLKGLRPRYLQRKAQKYFMENPNVTWNDFSTRIIQRDVSFQVSSNFLNDEEQTKAQLAKLGQEMKNLRSELQEHRVNAVEGNSRTVDPNQKGRQNATRFCNFDRTNGHTPSWCRKKIRDEELERIENERTAEKKSLLLRITTKNEDQIMDQNNGLEAKASKGETRFLRTIDLGEHLSLPTRIYLQDQTLHMGITIRIIEDRMINAEISQSTETMEIDLETDLSTTRMGTGETMEVYFVLRRLKEETSHKTNSTGNQELTNLITLRSADLTIDLRLVLRPTNNNFRKPIVRQHLMGFVSPQPTILSTKYQIFAR